MAIWVILSVLRDSEAAAQVQPPTFSTHQRH